MVKRITAGDVARAAGVSQSTVSFVLNATPGQSISEGVQQRVKAAARELGYQPDPHARALASGQSHVVLILLPEWPVEYLLRGMIDTASTVLDNAGYSLVTMDAHTSGHATPLWQTLRPDVVIAIDDIPVERATAIRAANTKLLLPREARYETYDTGSHLQLEHLVARNHRHIAFGSTAIPSMANLNDNRLSHMHQLANAQGITFQHARVTPESAAEVVGTWLADGVTAVAAFNDDVAALVAGAAIRTGIRIPTDLAIIGHDDTPLASMFVPALSSVRFNVADLGRGLAEQAIAAARGEIAAPIDEAAVQAEVITRESS